MADCQISSIEKKIVASVDRYEGESLDFLKRIVNINSGTMNIAGVRKVGEEFAEQYRKLGFQVEWISGDGFGRAGHLIATRLAPKGPKILMIGHLDTVFEPDSPFQEYKMVSDHLMNGPGALDMKGGDVVMLLALKALHEQKLLDNFSVKVFLVGDEELSGEPLALSKKDLIEAGKWADIALGYEDGDGFVVQGDVASAADRTRLVAETVRQFGRLDLLVNNAGVAPKVRADLLDAGEESFDRLFSINLKGPYFLTQLVAKQFLSQARDENGFRGRIVNITSISVYTASINRGDYCMVKAGLAMMTKLFADRLANDGINVYEIRPGVIATDMTGGVKEKYDKLIIHDERGITPIRRWGRPEDVGLAVRAIAEDRFPYSTGAVFDVDGGFGLQRL